MNFDWQRLRKIGEGSEKSVFIHPEEPDKIIARWDREMSEKEMKGMFYLSNILHMLFPENVPVMRLASKSKETVHISDKKEVDPAHRELQELQMSFRDYTSDSPGWRKYSKEYTRHDSEIGADPKYRKFLWQLKGLGITGLDVAQVNFGYDGSGNLLYLDTIDAWESDGRPCYDEAALREAIGAFPVDKSEKALQYLERLETLRQEAARDLQNGQSQQKQEQW